MNAAAEATPLAAIGAVFRLQIRRLVRGRKVRLATTALVLVWVALIGSRYAGSTQDPASVVRDGLSWGFFSLLAFVWPFVLNAGAIAEEVETETFTYLAARPVGRATLTLGKYLAGAAVAIGLGVVGVFVVHIACHLTDPTGMVEQLGFTLRALAALVLLLAFYCALCLFWGALLPEAAGIVSVLHLALLELALTWVPGLFRMVSLNYHARQLAGLPKRDLFASIMGPRSARLLPADVDPGPAVAVLVIATLLTLTLAAVVVRMSEYHYGKA